MTTITIQDIQARHAELTQMIERPTAQASTTVHIPEAAISLQPGEHYAGAVLDDAGQHKHHLVLMAPRPDEDLNWADAVAWAQGIGGTLPDRQEQALLYANCKPHLKPSWHWSSVTHEKSASYAWGCRFYDGSQYGNDKSYEGSAVAVRRV